MCWERPKSPVSPEPNIDSPTEVMSWPKRARRACMRVCAELERRMYMGVINREEKEEDVPLDDPDALTVCHMAGYASAKEVYEPRLRMVRKELADAREDTYRLDWLEGHWGRSRFSGWVKPSRRNIDPGISGIRVNPVTASVIRKDESDGVHFPPVDGLDEARLDWLEEHPRLTIGTDPNNKTKDNVDFPWWWKIGEEVSVDVVDGMDVRGVSRYDVKGEAKTLRGAIDKAAGFGGEPGWQE